MDIFCSKKEKASFRVTLIQSIFFFFLIKIMLTISFQKSSDKSMAYHLGEKNGMRTPVSPIV